MNNHPATKICKMCCMEIPEAARKCPHCHHFQNWLTKVSFHPLWHVLVALLPLSVMWYATSSMFDKGKDHQRYKDQIVITESQMAFGLSNSNATVAVMGAIKNNSPVVWKEVQLHVDFFDAQGRRIDVGQREGGGVNLATNATTSFKVSFRQEFPQTNYAKHKVQVVGAKDVRARW